MNNKGYKKLKVYQEAHKLVLSVYLITKKFPKLETFGLISQELKYITEDEYEELEKQRILVGSLLGGFIKYLKRDTKT